MMEGSQSSGDKGSENKDALGRQQATAEEGPVGVKAPGSKNTEVAEAPSSAIVLQGNGATPAGDKSDDVEVSSKCCGMFGKKGRNNKKGDASEYTPLVKADEDKSSENKSSRCTIL